MKLASGLVIVMLASSDLAFAGANDSITTQFHYVHYAASVRINEDGTSTGLYEWTWKVLNASALKYARRTFVYYDSSTQKAEVNEAYTLKADGRRIDVAKSGYQIEVKSHDGKNTPAYFGVTTLSVVFSDVAVGDSVVPSYKLVELDPMFPAHFSATMWGCWRFGQQNCSGRQHIRTKWQV